MKNFIITAVLFLVCYGAQSQIGIGLPNPDPSAVLELASNRQGFLPPRLTTIERDAIARPAVGLVIFNTTKNCLEWSLATGWYNACGDNGPGIVTSYSCDTAVVGGMTAGVPVSGVSQTITADVAVSGSYDISATANGVTFSASGNFTTPGVHRVVLIARGTPTVGGVHSFTLDTSPNTCSFSRTTSTGVGVVTRYTCNTGSTGTMTVGTAVTGVTQTITATVATIGSYNISAFINGVTFRATGTYTGINDQEVVLVATGTPTVAANNTFALAGTPTCTFTRVVLPSGPPTVPGAAGKLWMAWNLGATAPASSSADASQYGDLYQWGRGADGHQLKTSRTQASTSPGDTPGHGLFITTSSGTNDWRRSSNNNLWQGYTGINNPCPSGFRLPTSSEWTAEFAAARITNSGSAYASTLKLVIAGFRFFDGMLLDQSSYGYYWSSTVTGTNADYRYFHSITGSRNTNRASGMSVRCLKD